MTRASQYVRFILGSIVVVAAAACSSSTSPTMTSNAPYSQTDLVVGTGATAAAGNRITVSYTGWLYDATQPSGKGKQFETNPSYGPFFIGTGAVIKGWDQGVVGMKVGGQRRLVIPPELAYGSAGTTNGVIPPNATLVFDIALLGVS
jgi:FKBP-type peptidyl-prolyl cis-trans isomerase FkpA